MASGFENVASNFAAGFTRKAKKMPNAQISSVDNLIAGNGARFRFILTLNNFTYGFQSISGLSSGREFDSYEEGGVNDHLVYTGKFSGKGDKTLSLKRGMVLSQPSTITTAALAALGQISDPLARRTALMAVGATDAQYTLKHGPAFGDIKVYNPFNLKLCDQWTFLSLGVESHNFPDLDAESNVSPFEDLSLKVIDLKRKPLGLPSTVSTIMSYIKDDGYEENNRTTYQISVGSSYTGEEEGKGGALNLNSTQGSSYTGEEEGKGGALNLNSTQGSSYTGEEEGKGGALGTKSTDEQIKDLQNELSQAIANGDENKINEINEEINQVKDYVNKKDDIKNQKEDIQQKIPELEKEMLKLNDEIEKLKNKEGKSEEEETKLKNAKENLSKVAEQYNDNKKKMQDLNDKLNDLEDEKTIKDSQQKKEQSAMDEFIHNNR